MSESKMQPDQEIRALVGNMGVEQRTNETESNVEDILKQAKRLCDDNEKAQKTAHPNAGFGQGLWWRRGEEDGLEHRFAQAQSGDLTISIDVPNLEGSGYSIKESAQVVIRDAENNLVHHLVIEHDRVDNQWYLNYVNQNGIRRPNTDGARRVGSINMSEAARFVPEVKQIDSILGTATVKMPKPVAA